MRNFSSILRVGLVTLMLLPGLSAVANLGLGLNTAKAAERNGVGTINGTTLVVTITNVSANVDNGDIITLYLNPDTMPVNAAGTNVSVNTGTATRANDATANSITLTMTAAGPTTGNDLTFTMTDALGSTYNQSTYAIDWVYFTTQDDSGVSAVSNNTDTTIDDLDGDPVLEDDVIVRANVPVYLTLETSSNLVDLGLLSASQVSTGSVTLTLNTNDATGATISLRGDDQLNTAGDTADIDPVADTAVDGIFSGNPADEYGVTATSADIDIAASFDGIDGNVPSEADAQAAEAIASSTGAVDDASVIVTFKAIIDSTVAAGAYDQIVTFSALANI